MARIEVSNAAAFEAAVSGSFVPLAITSVDTPALRGSVEQKSAGVAAITLVRSEPVSLRRTPRLIAHSSRGVVLLTMQLRGTSIVAQRGTTARLGPGQGAIYFSDRPFDLRSDGRSEVLVFHAPLALFGFPDSQMALAYPEAFDARTDCEYRALRNLSRSYLRALPLIDDAQQMGRITTGLLAAIMTRNHPRRRRRLDHTYLFAALCSDIELRLHDPALSVSSLARAHGVSSRAVHECFEEFGSTPAAVFREKRLALATSLLGTTDLPIAHVARAVGMLDPSTLSKALRRATGMTARDIRTKQSGTPTGAV
ncbi:AraC family transcriptional regulator [Cryobacterium sp. SO1]|uniref:helix-turn-helix transcriptional regulator n=1 Tax=Cryobacterium sp. SO1 TaxID=1897061 RepID=UPI00102320C9|nr:AraC family transcriptional regulator [Cryobacterium sp. SO1]RZI35613.1 Transcriptional activator NphR [Cryobacterium sp. SO1]